MTTATKPQTPKCPQCGRHNTTGRESDNTLLCRTCLHRWDRATGKPVA